MAFKTTSKIKPKNVSCLDGPAHVVIIDFSSYFSGFVFATDNIILAYSWKETLVDIFTLLEIPAGLPTTSLSADVHLTPVIFRPAFEALVKSIATGQLFWTIFVETKRKPDRTPASFAVLYFHALPLFFSRIQPLLAPITEAGVQMAGHDLTEEKIFVV